MSHYRLFTLVLGTIDHCRDFSATDDAAALVQARVFEPSLAFELWHGNHRVARLPPTVSPPI